jgi:ubiquinone/menaquinone biosynthesis C-methylase UbiE
MKADYSSIASFFDRGRPLSDANTERWMDLVREAASPTQESRIMDLGCGTGRFAIPLARRFGCNVTGVDSSLAMLDKARQKSGGELVAWQQGDADHLDFGEESFDVVFMSHLLHHVASPLGTLKECHRVVRPGGSVLVRYGAIEHIRGDVEHVFFPETLAIDEPRSFSIAQLEAWMNSAGFSRVNTTTITQRTYESPDQHLQTAITKGTSVMTMISQEAHAAGVERMRKYVAEKGDDPWLVHDHMSLTWGVRNA